jgi:hypothetical protein
VIKKMDKFIDYGRGVRIEADDTIEFMIKNYSNAFRD